MDDRRRGRKNRFADNDTVRFGNYKIAWTFVTIIAVPVLGWPAVLTVVLLTSRESRVGSRESGGEKNGTRMGVVAAAPADRVKQHGRKRQPPDQPL